MKVIFMGTPDFAVGTLEEIVKAGHEVVLVVTQPDKPKGRGKEMTFPPVKEVALRHEIPVFQPVKVREAQCIDKLKEYSADIIVVVAFGQILPKEILELTPYGCINVHASLLPKYRGAAPIQWAIIDGEKVTGVTTMQMDEGLDTGDMLLKREVKITEDETGGTLHDKLLAVGAKLCIETLKAVESKTLCAEKQEDTTTSYARMLDKELGNINWHQSAVQIERLIRGLTPWPSAYSYVGDKIIKIWKAKVIETNTEATPGTIVKIEKNSFAVQTGQGQLIVEELQLQGKKRMDAGSFLRGHSLNQNEILIRR